MKNNVLKKFKTKKLSYLLIYLLTIVSCQLIIAQTPINLQAAIDSALKNNLTIKQDKLRSVYQKKIIQTAYSIPQTNVLGEFGQLNSSYYDNRLGVSQSMSFPSVYTHHKRLLNEEWKSSLIEVTLKEAEIKKRVCRFFYNYLYLNNKKQLLLRIDSIYSTFLDKVNIRFLKGESNVLEKTTAESQRGNISMQLNQLNRDLDIILIEFRQLLNTQAVLRPYETTMKMDLTIKNDSGFMNEHPLLKIIEQEKKISTISKQLETSKLLPDLTLGYYNMSMRGSGADNKMYDYSSRFQSIQVGLGIPLFFNAQKNKINAAQIQIQVSENHYLSERTHIIKEHELALLEYQSNLKTVNYFETIGLKNADLIFKAANQQFLNGEIDYLKWAFLVNQSIDIQSNYYDALNNLNESIIQINYLTVQ